MKNAIEMLRAVGAYESWLQGQPRKKPLRTGRKTIVERAKSCIRVTFAVVEDFDDLNRPHAFITSGIICPQPNGTGKVHKVEARLYNPFGQTSPTWVSCDCGNFRYTWEEDLVPWHSSSMRYVNGPDKNIRNPKHFPALCKHLVALLSYAVRSAKVRKVLFQTPSFKELGLKKQVITQRGIPERYPKRGRPVVERPVELRSKGRPKE